jgi:phage terminase large subunit-like protein
VTTRKKVNAKGAKKAGTKVAKKKATKKRAAKKATAKKTAKKATAKKTAKKTARRARAGTAGKQAVGVSNTRPRSRAVLTLPGDLAEKIDGLNRRWTVTGIPDRTTPETLMPERCALPTTAAGWKKLLKMLPGYDPFATGAIKREGLWVDVRRAVNAIAFFHEYLVHIKGEWANTPIWLEPWQQAFIANLLGWKRANGTRRYRKYLLYVPRKNAKTTLAAGLQLEIMCNDGEQGANIDCAAADREQARNLFDVAREMVARDAALEARLQRYQYSIAHKDSASAFKVLSADANTKHGGNTHSGVVDELHAQPNSDLYEVLETSSAARRQPLMGGLTTADYERPSLCNTMHDHAKAVRDGRLDDWQFLPGIWEAELADDWRDPKTWAKANPNLGVSVKPEFLEQAALKAEHQPSFLNTFLRLHLNVRTQQAEKWIDMQAWARCGPSGEHGDTSQARRAAEPVPVGGKMAVGVDLASTDDFAAMVLAWPEENPAGGEDLIRLRARFWIPESMAREREKRGVPVTQWARDGWLTMTPGERIDFATIEAEILGVCRRHGVREPAFDPWGAAQMIQRLQGEGLEPIEYQQSFRLSNDATRHLETLVATDRLRHDGDPVLAWMFGNTTLDRDTMDNVRPSKKKSGEKIDGVIASMMAVGVLIGRDTGPTKSVYEDRGLLVL